MTFWRTLISPMRDRKESINEGPDLGDLKNKHSTQYAIIRPTGRRGIQRPGFVREEDKDGLPH